MPDREALNRLFDEAVALPASERLAFVETATSDDPDLRRELEALLARDARDASMLDVAFEDLVLALLGDESVADSSGGDGARSISDARDRSEVERVGPYRLLREVGRGGMGTVFLAEREDGEFDRTVAIKLVKRGMDSDEILRRFRSERQILAKLEHPNIARMYDGGVAEDGRPYLAMEYVEGRRITEYADENRLTLAERVELFDSVTAAVRFAHLNLVVHRDLKPSNVLVTDDGTVKLLDFGIAKLLDEDVSATDVTRPGGRILTPAYAAPEQLDGGPITTATDVFSLGVLLHELLTGRRPSWRGEDLRLPSTTVRMKDGSPSVRDAGSSEEARPAEGELREQSVSTETLAVARGTTPDRLARALRGDLDTIVLKALRREPAGRYSSVEALARDLRSHLAGRPVSARPDHVGYRVRKFVRRNRVGVAASAAVVVALVGGLAASLSQARIASNQRDLAELEAAKATRVTEFLIDVFQAADPAEARADTLTAVQMLRRGAARIETELAGEPEVQGAVLNAIGQVYTGLSLYEEAGEALQTGLEIRKEHYGPEHAEVAASLYSLSELAYRSASPEMDSLFRETLTVSRRVLDPEDPALARTLLLYANRAVSTDWTLAERLLDEADSIFTIAPGDQALALARVRGVRGFLAQARGEYAEAEDQHRQALEVQLERLGPNHPSTLVTRSNMGFVLQLLGKYAAADSALQAVLVSRREVYGDRHLRVVASLYSLAELRYAHGDYDGAEAFIREAIEVRSGIDGLSDPEGLQQRILLAQILWKKGDLEGGNRLFDRITAEARALGGGGTALARGMNARAGILESQGDPEGAEALYRRAWQLYRDFFGEDHPFAAIVQTNVGAAAYDQGKIEEAEALYRDALPVLVEAYSEQHATVGTTYMLIGTLECTTRRFDDGEQSLRRAREILEATLGSQHFRLGQVQLRLGGCLAAAQRHEEAEPLLLSAREILEPRKGLRPIVWRNLLAALLDVNVAQDRPDRAAEYRALLMELEGNPRAN